MLEKDKTAIQIFRISWVTSVGWKKKRNRPFALLCALSSVLHNSVINDDTVIFSATTRLFPNDFGTSMPTDIRALLIAEVTTSDALHTTSSSSVIDERKWKIPL